MYRMNVVSLLPGLIEPVGRPGARPRRTGPRAEPARAGGAPAGGRVGMAVGKCGGPADRDRIGIRVGDIVVAEGGWISPAYKEAEGAAYMKNPEPDWSRQRLSGAVGRGSGPGACHCCRYR